MEGPTLELVDVPEGDAPWEAHGAARSWQDLWLHGERSPCCSRFAGRTCDPIGEPHRSSLFLKDCPSWKGSMLEQLMKNCIQWEGFMFDKFVEPLTWEASHAEAEEEHDEQGEAETTCDELKCNSHSPFHCTA
ncbi:hypothetical protein BTVI_17220 [Pitangus sulphuratus]|nr:hypothetical protein BTVI_17220 [Pitangus sulphuratus]